MLKDLNYITNYYSLPKFDENGSGVYRYFSLEGYHQSGCVNLRFEPARQTWKSFQRKATFHILRIEESTDFAKLLVNILKPCD